MIPVLCIIIIEYIRSTPSCLALPTFNRALMHKDPIGIPVLILVGIPGPACRRAGSTAADHLRIRAKSRTWSAMAASVGKRSIELAP